MVIIHYVKIHLIELAKDVFKGFDDRWCCSFIVSKTAPIQRATNSRPAIQHTGNDTIIRLGLHLDLFLFNKIRMPMEPTLIPRPVGLHFDFRNPLDIILVIDAVAQDIAKIP